MHGLMMELFFVFCCHFFAASVPSYSRAREFVRNDLVEECEHDIQCLALSILNDGTCIVEGGFSKHGVGYNQLSTVTHANMTIYVVSNLFTDIVLQLV